MIEDLIFQYVDKGFAYAVAIFLLWKGHSQDKEYLTVLTEIKNELVNHVKEKEALIKYLEK